MVFSHSEVCLFSIQWSKVRSKLIRSISVCNRENFRPLSRGTARYFASCDPLEAIILIGKEAWSQGDLKLAGKMFKELAQYVAPKRRSIEIRGSSEQEVVTFTRASFSNDVLGASPVDSKSALIEQG